MISETYETRIQKPLGEIYTESAFGRALYPVFLVSTVLFALLLIIDYTYTYARRIL